VQSLITTEHTPSMAALFARALKNEITPPYQERTPMAAKAMYAATKTDFSAIFELKMPVINAPITTEIADHSAFPLIEANGSGSLSHQVFLSAIHGRIIAVSQNCP
jgi:hypothetical protein